MPDVHRSIMMGGDRFPGQGMLLFNAGLEMAKTKWDEGLIPVEKDEDVTEG
jgi:hypothetical protein